MNINYIYCFIMLGNYQKLNGDMEDLMIEKGLGRPLHG